jgi:hypothetical protein
MLTLGSVLMSVLKSIIASATPAVPEAEALSEEGDMLDVTSGIKSDSDGGLFAMSAAASRLANSVWFKLGLGLETESEDGVLAALS